MRTVNLVAVGSGAIDTPVHVADVLVVEDGAGAQISGLTQARPDTTSAIGRLPQSSFDLPAPSMIFTRWRAGSGAERDISCGKP